MELGVAGETAEQGITERAKDWRKPTGEEAEVTDPDALAALEQSGCETLTGEELELALLDPGPLIVDGFGETRGDTIWFGGGVALEGGWFFSHSLAPPFSHLVRPV